MPLVVPSLAAAAASSSSSLATTTTTTPTVATFQLPTQPLSNVQTTQPLSNIHIPSDPWKEFQFNHAEIMACFR
jgi:hypothetical protein